MDKPPSTTHTMEFRYVRSPYYRNVIADGVFGGVSPKGVIRASFFSEKTPIPTRVVHELKDDPDQDLLVLGKEISKDTYTGVERELEVDVAMTLEMALIFHGWLGEKIKNLKELNTAPPQA